MTNQLHYILFNDSLRPVTSLSKAKYYAFKVGDRFLTKVIPFPAEATTPNRKEKHLLAYYLYVDLKKYQVRKEKEDFERRYRILQTKRASKKANYQKYVDDVFNEVVLYDHLFYEVPSDRAKHRISRWVAPVATESPLYHKEYEFIKFKPKEKFQIKKPSNSHNELQARIFPTKQVIIDWVNPAKVAKQISLFAYPQIELMRETMKNISNDYRAMGQPPPNFYVRGSLVFQGAEFFSNREREVFPVFAFAQPRTPISTEWGNYRWYRSLVGEIIKSHISDAIDNHIKGKKSILTYMQEKKQNKCYLKELTLHMTWDTTDRFRKYEFDEIKEDMKDTGKYVFSKTSGNQGTKEIPKV